LSPETHSTSTGTGSKQAAYQFS